MSWGYQHVAMGRDSLLCQVFLWLFRPWIWGCRFQVVPFCMVTQWQSLGMPRWSGSALGQLPPGGARMHHHGTRYAVRELAEPESKNKGKANLFRTQTWSRKWSAWSNRQGVMAHSQHSLTIVWGWADRIQWRLKTVTHWSVQTANFCQGQLPSTAPSLRPDPRLL